MNNTENGDMIKALETRIKHLENELKLSKDEYGHAISKYYDLYINMENKVKEESLKLAESEKKYRRIFERIQDVYFETDTKGNILEISPSVFTVSGYTREELIGTPIDNFFRDPAGKNTAIETIIKLKQLKDYEIDLNDKTGNCLQCSVNGILIKDRNDNPFKIVGIFRSIKDQKLANEEKIKREKLQGVIETAGAVCHELNQPLYAISGYSELLLMDIPPEDPMHDTVRQIKSQVDRMGDITKKMMNITRYETMEYAGGTRIIDINKSSGENGE